MIHHQQMTFGFLLQSIRTELQTLFDPRTYTQEAIGQLIGESSSFVSEVERGKKAKIDAHIFKKLTQSLPLTMREQREMCAVALGLTRWGEAVDDQNKVVLECQNQSSRLKSLLNRQRYPGLIVDQYLNILYTHRGVFDLLGFPQQTDEGGTKFQHNFMYMLFADEHLGYRDKWSPQLKRDLLYNNLYLYRTSTMRYRHTEFFTKLHEKLMSQDEFYAYLRRSYTEVSMSKYSTRPLNLNEYKHSINEKKELSYLVNVSPVLSPYGELYTILYTPEDDYTSEVFEETQENFANDPVVSLANWEINTL